MAQDFSLRYTLVDGQGNFGSIDGDNAAAMRLHRMPHGSYRPTICCRYRQGNRRLRAQLRRHGARASGLPTRIPNLLINGSSGIAVGMATSIPPHNPREVVDGRLELLDEPGHRHR